MKKILLTLSVVVIGVAAYLFYQDKSKTSIVDMDTNQTKVGFVYLTTPGDHGWTYAHELGKQMVEKHFGENVKISVVENVPEGPDATRVIRELAKQGNEIIFTTSFGYMDPTLKVAKEFPDIKFEHITGYKRSANVATGNIRFYEGRYIQGVVAGLMTKTNKIGYIGAYPIAEVIMGINAFAQGLKSVNKDASISVIWANTCRGATACRRCRRRPSC